MSNDSQEIIDNLNQSPRNGAGSPDPELRRAVATYARDISLDENAANSRIASDQFPYQDKVSLYAYKIPVREVDALKANNYSDNEDERFGLTISAALRAGLARLERGMTLLNN